MRGLLKKKYKYSRKVKGLIKRGHSPQCACCGTPDDLTFDHIIPIKLQGQDDYSNGQILCQYCNETKKDRIISLDQLRKEIPNQ